MEQTVSEPTLWLKIQNKGTDLPEEAFRLMGASVKGEDTIGMFGTGIKYSYALALRKNIGLKIFVDNKEFVFSTKEVTLKGKTFEQILINGKPTDLTTSMGKDWTEWFMVREFLSNAVDESNDFEIDLVPAAYPVKGYSTIYIEATHEIRHVYNNLDKYFNFFREPIFSLNDIKGYPVLNSEMSTLYRRGVLICKNNSYKGVYDYDIKNATVNEYREGDVYYVSQHLVQFYVKHASVELIKKLLKTTDNNEGDYIEFYCDSGYALMSNSYNKNWETALEGKRVIPSSLAGWFVDTYNPLTDYIINDRLFEGLKNSGLNIQCIGGDDDGKFRKVDFDELEPVQKAVYNKGIEFCNECEYTIKYPIEIVDFVNESQLGMFYKQTIYISSKQLSGVHPFLMTLVEENEHGKSGHPDRTRSFQNHLIDLFIKEKSNRFAFVI